MAIQLRRGNQEDLVESNLLPAEPAYCLDTGRLVIGDGEGGADIIPTGAEVEQLINNNVNPKLANKLDKTGGTIAGGLTVLGSVGILGSLSIGNIANFKAHLGIGKQIWPVSGGEGLWSSGNITVPEINNYVMYFVTINGTATVIPAFRYQSGSVVYFRGIGGYPSSSTRVITYQFAATVAGTTLTLVKCNTASHASNEGHGAMSDRYVTAIYGLI